MNRNARKELPLVSGSLVAVNVIVFLICSFTGNLLYSMGRLEAYGILVEGEYGRILWALFLHGDMEHIFNNMLLLFFMGGMIEKEIGHCHFAIVYFLSGIGGNLVSLLKKMVSNSAVGSIGASGAVFGLDGVLLALVLFSGRSLENITPGRVGLMILYSLYSGFAGKNIDNAAHIGGLLTGFVLGSVICVMQRRKHNKEIERCNGEY